MRLESAAFECGGLVGTVSCWFPRCSSSDTGGGMALVRVGRAGCLLLPLRGARVASGVLCLEDSQGRRLDLRLLSRL